MLFLGILFDSMSMTIRLDDEKLASIHAELALWNDRHSASREELQSIIGVLSFAAKVVPTGRTFLRRMIDHLKNLPSTASNTAQFPLSKSFRLDLHMVATIPHSDGTESASSLTQSGFQLMFCTSTPMPVSKASVPSSALTGSLASGQSRKKPKPRATNATPCHSRSCTH